LPATAEATGFARFDIHDEAGNHINQEVSLPVSPQTRHSP